MFITLSDGTKIEVVNNTGSMLGSAYSDTEEQLKLEKSIDPIVKLAKEALATFTDEVKPTELEISLGAEAGAKGGLFGLAQAHGKATMIIKMTWRP